MTHSPKPYYFDVDSPITNNFIVMGRCGSGKTRAMFFMLEHIFASEKEMTRHEADNRNGGDR